MYRKVFFALAAPFGTQLSKANLIEFIIELHHFICISQPNYAKIDRKT